MFSNEDLLKQFNGYRINREGSFVPETMEVRWQGGQPGNSMSKRLVFFGTDQMQYKVFNLAIPHQSMTETADEDVSMS
jgi:hypothetical protein